MKDSNGDSKLVDRRRVLTAMGAIAGVVSVPRIGVAQTARLEKVRMAAWSPRLAEQANIYVSEEKGFFKAEGIDMEWIPGQGSGDALKNVIAGNADIAFVGPEAILFAADKGSRLKAVYDIYPQNVFNVFSLKKANITKPQDLRGKKVGVISMASGTRYNLATILAVNGMSEKDVELVALGMNAAPAIIEGKVDAMAAIDSILLGMQAAGLGPVNVIWARDYLNVSCDLFTVEEKNFSSKKDLYTRFLRGYRKGVDDMIKNPADAAEIAMKYSIDGKDLSRVTENIKLRVASSQSAFTQQHGLGWIDVGPLQVCAKVYKDAGFVKNEINLSQIVTNELVEVL